MSDEEYEHAETQPVPPAEPTLQQKFAQWLSENSAEVQVYAEAPTGELVQMASVIRPGLLDWKMKFVIVTATGR